jgi:hypothetical protein
MSEEKLKAFFDNQLQQEEVEQPEEESQEVDQVEEYQPELEQQEQSEQPQYSAIEQEAIDMGWNPDKEGFIEKGGDPDRYVSAHEYIRYGKLQKSTNDRIQSMERKFNEQLENLNKYHSAQLEQKLQDAMARQRTAVEEADVDAYDQAQKEINDIYQTAQPVQQQQQPEKDPLIADWESENPWVMDATNPKTAHTNVIYRDYLAKNPYATTEQVLNYLDSQLNRFYPSETNPRREAPSNYSERGNKTPNRAGSRKSRDLTMADLTPAEQREWQQFGKSMFGSEKDFLKAVQNSRKK